MTLCYKVAVCTTEYEFALQNLSLYDVRSKVPKAQYRAYGYELSKHPKRDLKFIRYSTQTVILMSISPSVCKIEVKKTKRFRPQSAQSAVQSVGIGTLRALRGYISPSESTSESFSPQV